MKKLIVASILTALSFSSAAQWQGSINLSKMSEDDVDLNMVTFDAKYDFAPEQQMHWLAGVRYGVGQGDDVVGYIAGYDLKGEIDSFLAFDVRGQYESTDNVYLFTTLSYARAELTAKFRGNSVTDSENDAGFGVGLGYRLTDSAALEVSYQKFDDSNILSGGVTWKF